MAEVTATPGADLLLEVRVEEIPARMLPGATQELGTRIFEELMARGLAPASIDGAFTPRRLMVWANGVPPKGRPVFQRIIGPATSVAFGPDGTPTQAALGFARRLQVPVEKLSKREFSPNIDESDVPQLERGLAITVLGQPTSRPVSVKVKGEYVYVPIQVPGLETREVLAELLPRVLNNLAWAKTMRWGAGTGPWVRPVHSIVALFDGEVVPFELFGIAAGARTIGHPTLSPEPFAVTSVEQYLAELGKRGIVPVPAERKRLLAERMAGRARALGGTLVEDSALLDKLAAICEIPGVMEGSFPQDLVALPREVLATSLRDHQSALTVEKDGALLPVFLTVMDRPDDPIGRVQAGNEWVVAARLADAKFFFEKDRATKLADRAPLLASLVFQEKLGSYAEKTQRIIALSRSIAAAAGINDSISVERAAALLKVDLTTDMVKEFTSLQGQIGGIYARAEGMPEAVWSALYDQYLPASAGDAIPRGAVAQVVALADRIDTLVGFFGLGLVPSGSKDPFGLRRAALGVVRILLDGQVRLNLSITIRLHYSEWLQSKTRAGVGRSAQAFDATEDSERLVDSLSAFLLDRFEFALGEQGFAYDEIAAARGADLAGNDKLAFRDLRERAAAIRRLCSESNFIVVAQAAKRISKILAGQPKSTYKPLDAPEAERALAQTVAHFRSSVQDALLKADYFAGLQSIAELAIPLQKFFEMVMVMDPDHEIRRNRLALLQSIQDQIIQFADLSLLARGSASRNLSSDSEPAQQA